ILILFFKAEDGIRDFHVTGVQTCALPIFWVINLNESELLINIAHGLMIPFENPDALQLHVGQLLISALLLAILYLLSAHWFDKRSEERRVGKEYVSRGQSCHEKDLHISIY